MMWPWSSSKGKPRGSVERLRKDRAIDNANAIMAAGDTADETDRLIDSLHIMAPKARAALANRPSHAAWAAIRDAEAVTQGKLPRARALGPYIETLRGIAAVVARHAGS